MESDESLLISQSSSEGNSDSTADVASINGGERKEAPNGPIFTVEPVVLLLFMALTWTATILQNQILFQTCSVIYGHNVSDCLLLGTENASEVIVEIERTVEPYAAKIFMAKSLIDSILPACISMFLGPWSDKHGRKPILISTVSGLCMTYGMIAMLQKISTTAPVNPWLFVLAYIPNAITGGNSALITSIFCYVTDVVTENNRAMRMALLEASIYVGLVIGSLSSSFIYQLTSATFVFSISTGAVFLALLYCIFFVKESIQFDVPLSKCTKLRKLFDFNLVKDMLVTCFEKRPSFDRSILWLTISTLGISIFIMEGSSTVDYMFARNKFHWTIREFTFYEATSTVVQIFGNIVGVYILNKLLGVSEIKLTLIAYVSCIMHYCIKSVANLTWHMYAATGVSVLRGIAGPMARTILSNVVPGSDIGKIFSFTTSIESLTPLAASPLYGFVYSNTLDYFPGAYNLMSSGFYLICFFLIVIVHILNRRHPVVPYGSIST